LDPAADIVQRAGLSNLVVLVLNRKDSPASQPDRTRAAVFFGKPKVIDFCVLVLDIGSLDPE
jgi:hypothetical protein